VKLADLKTQALRYVALGEHEQGLLLYRSILQQLPADLDARMKVADLLVHLQQNELACRVYAAVAWCDLQAGRPLHALVCGQALSDLGQGPGAIHDTLVALYGADSDRLARGRSASGRLRPLDPEQPLQAGDLQALPGNVAAESAAEVAADTETFTSFPSSLAPLPLLSDLSGEPLRQLLASLLVRRLGPRASLFKEGGPSYSLYLVASGAVEAFREGPPRQVLLRFAEGALLGERALLGGAARPASCESCEPTDLVELPARTLRQAAEDPQVAAAIERHLRDRLARQLLGRSPLVTPLSTGQRLDLLRRFQGRELPADSLLLREGEVQAALHVILSGQIEAIRGSEPFETVLERFGPGDAIGEIGLCRPQPSTATLRVAAPAQVASLSREAFDKVAGTISAAQRHLQGLSADDLRELGLFGRSLLPRPGTPLSAEEDDELRAEFPLLL
jgi:CRP-like cAMP-binding protein